MKYEFKHDKCCKMYSCIFNHLMDNGNRYVMHLLVFGREITILLFRQSREPKLGSLIAKIATVNVYIIYYHTYISII